MDIFTAITKRFPLLPDQLEVKEFLESFWGLQLNVGPDQLARAILHLADGNIAEIRKIKDSHFLGDPRDLIMLAHGKPGKNGAGPYFTERFRDSEPGGDLELG